MAKYRVLEKSFIDNVLHEAGVEIDFEGTPSTNLEPLDAPAKKASADGKQANRQSLARQKDAARGININDPDDPVRKAVEESE